MAIKRVVPFLTDFFKIKREKDLFINKGLMTGSLLTQLPQFAEPR